MAEPNSVESKGDVKAGAKTGLPDVESPSISPAVSGPVAVEEPAIAPKPEPEVMAKSERAPEIKSVALVPFAQKSEAPEAEMPKVAPFFTLKARHRRYARMAASVAIGAVLGAIGGTLLTAGFATPRVNVAALEENQAMQQSITRLAKDVTTLKTQFASSDKIASELVATGAAKSPEKILQESADITGSISTPQTVAVAALPVSVLVPRPAPRIAMAETQPARPPVVRDWSIRAAQGGYIYVEAHGEIYQIVPGAPLPGLGPVQSIKRQEGRWVVTTPKGIIVSMRDRRYFE
ncbi:MAG TPA: hypothetical protein VIJ78_03465 [Pseudolabrys sp.]|nr:hypothetical protein [Pseudolabrys sp.]